MVARRHPRRDLFLRAIGDWLYARLGLRRYLRSFDRTGSVSRQINATVFRFRPQIVIWISRFSLTIVQAIQRLDAALANSLSRFPKGAAEAPDHSILDVRRRLGIASLSLVWRV